jgi:pyridoxal phosphate enzyme (YggS family)
MPESLSRPRIEDQLADVRRRIAAAANRAGRGPDEIRLVVVTKGQTPETVVAAYQAGVRDFGENRVEEALPKLEAVGPLPGAAWHMIGHIQSRKARRVVPAFDWVHAVDRLKIAHLLDVSAGEMGAELDVFLEVNVSGEDTKEGWGLSDERAWAAAVPELAQVAGFAHLRIHGLMTMAPWSPEPETARPVFRRLHALQGFLNEALGTSWNELSMGMTDDFEVAVEEGATFVRIGRAVFAPP